MQLHSTLQIVPHYFYQFLFNAHFLIVQYPPRFLFNKRGLGSFLVIALQTVVVVVIPNVSATTIEPKRRIVTTVLPFSLLLL